LGKSQVIFGNDPKETAIGVMSQWSKTTREIVFPERRLTPDPSARECSRQVTSGRKAEGKGKA
jgi:hypothetical protein